MIEAILDLLAEGWAESAHGATPFSRDRARHHVTMLMQNPNVYLQCIPQVGVISGIVVDAWAFNGKIAIEQFTYVRTSHRGKAGLRLISDWLEWARSRGVLEILCAVSFGGEAAERTGSLYEKLGMRRVGGVYVEIQ